MTTTKRLLKLAAAGITLMILAFIAKPSGTKPMSTNASLQPADTSNFLVCKKLDKSQLEKAIEKSESKKIILNIFPVKRSADPGKNDFDLEVLYQDVYNFNTNVGGTVNKKLFETGSVNYMKFLRSRHVAKQTIPFGYRINVDGTTSKEKEADICVYALPVANNNTDQTGYPKPLLRSDSCRCPPGCPCPKLLMHSKINQSINYTYKDTHQGDPGK